MKLARVLLAVSALGLACAVSLMADGSQGKGSGGNGNGKQGSGKANWGQIQAYLESLKNSWRSGKPAPPRPEPTIPDDLKALVQEAKQAAMEFAQKQKELVQQIKTATEAEREQLREQLRAARDAFREEQKQRVQEIKAQMLQMREQFRDNRDELIEAAKEKRSSVRGR